MIDGKSVLALIPARGGSKRLPRKNIMDLAGKPLIAWTIEAAKNSSYIDEIIVSTDDIEIESTAVHYGANVPFKRPDNLASDTATSNDAIIHAIKIMLDRGVSYDLVVVLQPTSPLREFHDIDSALELMELKKARGIVTVCECEHSPLWSNTLPADRGLGYFIREGIKNKRSQDLPVYYRLNGSIYAYDVKSVLEEGGVFYDDTVFAHVMPTVRSVDIDVELDFIVAAAIIGQK